MTSIKMNHIKKNKRLLNSFISVVSLVIFIACTAFGAIESFNDITEIESTECNIAGNDLSNDNTDHFSDNFSHNPFRLPSDPNPFKEDKDEKDNVDEKEWSELFSFCNSPIKNNSDNEFAAQSIKQFEQSIANRSRISLFVLHHSWKTFLI